jgi:putative transposase
MRNALAHADKGQPQMVLALIKTVFAQETFQASHDQRRVVADQLRAKYPAFAKMMDESKNAVFAYMSF